MRALPSGPDPLDQLIMYFVRAGGRKGQDREMVREGVRERVNTTSDDGTATYEKRARALCRGKCTADRWIVLPGRTGSVDPLPMGGVIHEPV